MLVCRYRPDPGRLSLKRMTPRGKVLPVDDGPGNRAVLEELRARGYAVATAASGAGAPERVRQHARMRSAWTSACPG